MNWIIQLERWVAPIKRAIQSMVIKAVVEAVDDSTSLQLLRVTVGADEALPKVERLQPHGLSSVPPVGAEALVISAGGEKEHAVVVVVDSSATRPTGLSTGEVCVYRDSANKVYIRANGDIDIVAEGAVNVKAGTINLGDGSAFKKLVNEEFVDVFNNHVHNFTVASTGQYSTSTPARVKGSIVGTPSGGVVAGFLGTMGSGELTSKTRAE